MEIVKSSVKKLSMLAITLAVLAAALLMIGEDAYAFDGPGNPHWDKTKAAWNAETTADGRSTIYYLKIYETKESGEVEKIKDIQLTNKTSYEFKDYLNNVSELEGKTYSFKVSYKFAGGYMSADSESGKAVFRNVELRDTFNEYYQNSALARLGDLMDLPDPPENDDYYFGGWSNSSSGSPLWNFGKDKVTEEMYADGSHLALYATWISKDEAHTHDGITFEPWVYGDTLPNSGHYYLVDDVYLRSTPSLTGTVDLCLNGKTIYGRDKVRAMNINEGADVRIFDDGDEGSIQGNSSPQMGYNDGVILVQGGDLTLNSGKIKNGFGYGNGGNVSITSGTFTMNGGSITGGTAGTKGAGVYVGGGEFTMNGGIISGNRSRYRFGQSDGGGVCVDENAKFTMNGGIIKGNAARDGGGVCARPGKNVTISGGTITENTSYWRGGGIWCTKSAVNITAEPGSSETDTIIIKNNKCIDDDGYEFSNNFYMYYYSDEDTVQPVLMVGAKIHEGSSIGVGGSFMPKEYESVGKRFKITSGLGQNGNADASAFFSTDDGCKIVLENDGEAWLARNWKVEYKAGNHGTGDMSDKNTRVVDEESYTIEENGFEPEQYYEFTGWKAGKYLYEEREEIPSVVDDYTFTAQWKPKEYTAAYDLAGGSMPDGVTNPVTFTGLTDTFTLNNPVRTGYEFTGWTGTGLDEPSKEVTVPQGTTENKEYTANWKPITYTITYRLNGGKLPEGKENPTEYTVETETFSLVNPELRGYTFVGWVGTDSTSETKNITIEKGSSGDRAYFANYEEGCPEGSHEFGAWETTIKPTCTEAGERTKTCAVCGAKQTEQISPIGHDYEFTEWTWIGDEVNGYKEATIHYACVNEGCDKTQFWRVDPVVRTIQPTCTEGGKTEYKAEISQLKAYDNKYRSQTKYAKFIDSLGHDYQVSSEAIEATCTSAGKEADQECSRCHDVIDGKIIPATGHTWGEWTVKTPTTETQAGEETRVCENDPSHVESRVIPVPGHVHVCSKVEAHDATCMQAGNREYWICDGGDTPCGRYFSDKDGKTEIDIEDVIIYPVGHVAGQAERENVVRPTCEDNGTFEEVVYCSVCGAELRRTNFATPALGHTPGEPELMNVVPATCTEDGSFEEIIDCTVCHKETAHSIGIIPAAGHQWDEGKVTKEATESEEGEKLFTCTRCKETRKEIIPKIKRIDNAKVILSKAAFKYNAKVQKPEILSIGGMKLEEGKDYTAKWSNYSSKNAGKYSVTITGIGGYIGTTKATYVIKKASNKLKVSGKTATVKFSKLKKKSQTLKASKVLKFANKGKGKLSYKKYKGSKKITINKKTGKVTVKKGLKKGKYTVRVKVKAAGTSTIAPLTKKVKITIKVK